MFDRLTTGFTAENCRKHELIPSGLNKGPTLGLRRKFIELPKTLPTNKLGMDVHLLTSYLSEEELHELVEDGAASPNLKGDAVIPTAPRQVCWSPLDETTARSLLAVLYTSGSLELYRRSGAGWEVMTDVALQWTEVLRAGWEDLNPNRVSHKSLLVFLKERAHRAKITSYVWSEGRKSGHSFLFTVTVDGTVCCWDVNSPKSEVTLLNDEPKLANDTVTALSYLSGFPGEDEGILFLATSTGQIKTIRVILSDSSVNLSRDLSTIWLEEDKIQVKGGGLQSRLCKGKALLVAAKGSHLVLISVNKDLSVATKGVFNTSDVTITGMSFLNDSKILVASWSRNVYVASVDPQMNSSSWLSVDVIEIPNRSDHMALVGLDLSRSKCCAVLAYTLQGAYDHLVIRELSSQSFCSLQDAKTIIFNYDGPLRHIWDALEVLRIECTKKTNTIELFQIDQMDVMSITDLKKNLWFVLALSHLESAVDSYKAEISRLKCELTLLIVSHHVFKRVSLMLSEDRVSGFHLKSLTAARCWLKSLALKLNPQTYVATLEIARTLFEQIEESYGLLTEDCLLCDEKQQDFSGDERFMICGSNHTMPRCSVSLVPCDVVPYYFCPRCSLIAHPIAVEEDKERICLFCDGFLEKDTRLIEE